MQEKEFDNLMNGKPAVWADETALENQLMKFGEVENKEQAEAEAMRLVQQPVPDNVVRAISIYVAIMRKKKVKERTIRRNILRKWNIRIVAKGESSLPKVI